VNSTHLSPGPDLPGGAVLLLAHLHGVGLGGGGAAEAVVQAVLGELAPGLPVLVAFPARHEALTEQKEVEELTRHGEAERCSLSACVCSLRTEI